MIQHQSKAEQVELDTQVEMAEQVAIAELVVLHEEKFSLVG